ncbi:hypothetical protein Tcan_01355, partial [Toxocara canis]
MLFLHSASYGIRFSRLGFTVGCIWLQIAHRTAKRNIVVIEACRFRFPLSRRFSAHFIVFLRIVGPCVNCKLSYLIVRLYEQPPTIIRCSTFRFAALRGTQAVNDEECARDCRTESWNGQPHHKAFTVQNDVSRT